MVNSALEVLINLIQELISVYLVILVNIVVRLDLTIKKVPAPKGTIALLQRRLQNLLHHLLEAVFANQVSFVPRVQVCRSNAHLAMLVLLL